MKILSLDSSATVASVAITEDEKLLGEFTLSCGNTHSETLLPMVESLLGSLSLTVADIDLFAASVGPGSFTGVRIGTATVKGLAFASNKPCVAVSTLHALAYNLVGSKGLICPVMNARRSQVYTALFSSDGESLTRLMEDSPLTISELDSLLSEKEGEIRLVGDGYDVTVSGIEKTRITETQERARYASAYSVARVALDAFRRGETVSDRELVSTYLRPSQAERERNEKLKKEQVTP